jgi:hypothetical protein
MTEHELVYNTSIHHGLLFKQLTSLNEKPAYIHVRTEVALEPMFHQRNILINNIVIFIQLCMKTEQFTARRSQLGFFPLTDVMAHSKTEAMQLCKRYGLILPEPRSNAEMDYLQRQIRDYQLGSVFANVDCLPNGTAIFSYSRDRVRTSTCIQPLMLKRALSKPLALTVQFSQSLGNGTSHWVYRGDGNRVRLSFIPINDTGAGIVCQEPKNDDTYNTNLSNWYDRTTHQCQEIVTHLWNEFAVADYELAQLIPPNLQDNLPTLKRSIGRDIYNYLVDHGVIKHSATMIHLTDKIIVRPLSPTIRDSIPELINVTFVPHKKTNNPPKTLYSHHYVRYSPLIHLKMGFFPPEGLTRPNFVKLRMQIIDFSKHAHAYINAIKAGNLKLRNMSMDIQKYDANAILTTKQLGVIRNFWWTKFKVLLSNDRKEFYIALTCTSTNLTIHFFIPVISNRNEAVLYQVLLLPNSASAWLVPQIDNKYLTLSRTWYTLPTPKEAQKSIRKKHNIGIAERHPYRIKACMIAVYYEYETCSTCHFGNDPLSTRHFHGDKNNLYYSTIEQLFIRLTCQYSPQLTILISHKNLTIQDAGHIFVPDGCHLALPDNAKWYPFNKYKKVPTSLLEQYSITPICNLTPTICNIVNHTMPTPTTTITPTTIPTETPKTTSSIVMAVVFCVAVICVCLIVSCDHLANKYVKNPSNTSNTSVNENLTSFHEDTSSSFIPSLKLVSPQQFHEIRRKRKEKEEETEERRSITISTTSCSERYIE